MKSPIPSESICQLEFVDDVFADLDEAYEIVFYLIIFSRLLILGRRRRIKKRVPNLLK